VVQLDRGEECDDGGTCIGSTNAGARCTGATQCPGGVCKPFGGDGCAANCTKETLVQMNLKPGETEAFALKPGTSGMTIYNAIVGQFVMPFPPGATQTLAVGKARNGQIPLVVLANSVHIPKIDVYGLACACMRGVAAKTCGGMAFNADGSAATDCTEGFTAGASVCPANLPCAFVHGNGGTCSVRAKICGQNSDCPSGETCVLGGNSASGVISCVSGLEGVDSLFTQDSRGATDPAQCDPNNPCADDNPCVPPDCDCWKPTTGSVPGLCGDPPVLALSGTGPAGSVSIVNTTAIGQVVGACGANPATFCTPADPIDVRGTPTTLPFISGTASAAMYGINPCVRSCDVLQIKAPRNNLAGRQRTPSSTKSRLPSRRT
jgi:hypothetical protein